MSARIALLAALALPLAARAARADGDHASLSLYRVTPGKTDAFVAGYAQHIRWHIAARDPWAWYVWEVQTGADRGLFVGGSFDHAWEERDRRPRPAEDAADHKRTIDVHQERSTPRYLSHRRDLGGTLPLLENTAQLVVIEIRPIPGRRDDLEDAARRLAAAAGPEARYGWFEVVVGGPPAYLLFVPVARSADLGTSTLAALWRAPAARAAAVRTAVDRLESAAASIDTVLLGFRPDMSSCVRAESKCVGVVPAP